MYFLPEYHGHEDCLVHVSEQQVDEMEEHCETEQEENIFHEYFGYVLETESLAYPCTANDALRLYQIIISLQNE